MNDPTSTDEGEPKRRSFSDTLSLFRPIVPLPGGPVRAPESPAVPVIPEADLPDEATGPQAVPLPPAVPQRVVAQPATRPPAGMAAVPMPGAAPMPPPPVVEPVPAPVAAMEPEPVVAISPMPRADSPARPDLAASEVRRRRRAWPWALLALVVAGLAGAALWIQHAPPPATLPPRAAAPAPPEAAAAGPEPLPAIAESLPATPLPKTPAPVSQPPPAPEPPAQTAQTAPEVPTAALPEPGPPASAQLAIERVTIFHHPDSSIAETAAQRLTDRLAPLAAEVETRTAAANFRLPTIRYFHADDAAGAQRLAAALNQPGAEWRVASILNRRPRPQPGTFEVWLTVR